MLKFSMVVPIYNVEKYLAACLKSLVSQDIDLTEYEIILVDDGSTDNSYSIMEQYQQKYANIKIISQSNRGISSARNSGILAAQGKYLMYLDSDDFLADNCLAYIYEQLETKQLDGYFFDGYAFLDGILPNQTHFSEDTYNRKKDYGYYEEAKDLFYQLSQDNKLLVTVALAAVKTEIIQQNQLLFKEGMISEDEVYTMQLIPLLKKVKHENKLFYQRRVRSGSYMQSNNASFKLNSYLKAFDWIEKEYHKTNDAKLREIFRLKLSQIIRSCGRVISETSDGQAISQEKKAIKKQAQKYHFFDLKTRLIWLVYTNKYMLQLKRILSK